MKFSRIVIAIPLALLLSGQSIAGQAKSEKNSVYSSTSVWSPVREDAAYSAWQSCDDLNCVIAYMKKSGATEDSMRIVRKLDGDGYLEAFEEKGRVDIGRVTFPARANTNSAYVLLNGHPALISTELKADALDLSRDPNYPKLKEKYQELQAWPASASLVSMSAGPDGSQRFTFVYYLVDGCHACGIPWGVEVAFEFNKDGKFKGTKVLRIVPNEK